MKAYTDVQLLMLKKVTKPSLKTPPPCLLLPHCLNLLLLSSSLVAIFFVFVILLTCASPPCVPGLQNITMADRFDCDNCKESLYGRKYIQSDDSPYCIPCYDSLFSNTCDECKELIGHDARVRRPFWHDQACNQHETSSFLELIELFFFSVINSQDWAPCVTVVFATY